MGIMHRKILYSFVLVAVWTALAAGDLSAVNQRSLDESGRSQEAQLMARKIFLIGVDYYKRKVYQEAISAFKAALRLDSTNKEIQRYLEIAQHYGAQKDSRNDAPSVARNEALGKRIHDLYLSGQYALRYKRYEEAIQYFQDVLNLDPGHEGAWSRLAEAQSALEKETRREPLAGVQAVEKPAIQKRRIVRQETYRVSEGPSAGEIMELEKEVRKKRLIDRLTREKGESALAQAPAPPVSYQDMADSERKIVRDRFIRELAETEQGAGIMAQEEPVPSAISGLKGRESAERVLQKTREEKDLQNIYSRAEEMLRMGYHEDAYKEFQKVAERNINFRNTKYYLADIRKNLEAERRDKRPPQYTLGPDDILEINVLNHPEFSGKATIEAGGEIILPLSKEVIMVSGLTKEELAKAIAERLSKYVKSPEVQIVITGYNSKKWYILGEVGIRGEYPMGKTNLTLMEALYQARLPLEGSAAMRRVVLIRPHKTHPKQRWIDAFSILYEGKMKDNVRIEPGDIIYVPKTVINKFSTTISQITTPVTTTKTGLDDTRDLSTTIKEITPFKYTLTPRVRQ